MKLTSICRYLFLLLLSRITSTKEQVSDEKANDLVDCKTLVKGQYLCPQPDIDTATQQPRDCDKVTKTANIQCFAAPGIICKESQNNTFIGETNCNYTNGYHFDTALMLSIFLGMFGADRFYLGYPALGLLKFSTLGFFFLGHLLDIILIASQVVKPADGSDYIISYYGAGLKIVMSDSDTAKYPQSDWY